MATTKIYLYLILLTLIGSAFSTKYQILRILESQLDSIATTEFENFQTAVIQSCFLKGKSAGQTEDAFITQIKGYFSAGDYIIRSDTKVYKFGGNKYHLMPSIKGNHPTKHLVYTHYAYNPTPNFLTTDKYDPEAVKGSCMYYRVDYFDCLDKALSMQTYLSSIKYRTLFTSVWTPDFVHTPSELRPFKSYFNAVYNIPYPFATVGSRANLYNQIKLTDVMIEYSASGANEFKLLRDTFNADDAVTLNNIFGRFASVTTSCDRISSPIVTADAQNGDILINTQALLDPDYCVNMNVDESEVTSNSYLCSSDPEAAYLDTDNSPACVEQLYVIEKCVLENNSLSGISSVTSINYPMNLYYRSRRILPYDLTR